MLKSAKRMVTAASIEEARSAFAPFAFLTLLPQAGTGESALWMCANRAVFGCISWAVES